MSRDDGSYIRRTTTAEYPLRFAIVAEFIQRHAERRPGAQRSRRRTEPAEAASGAHAGETSPDSIQRVRVTSSVNDRIIVDETSIHLYELVDVKHLTEQ